jgi:hypothetical protein
VRREGVEVEEEDEEVDDVIVMEEEEEDEEDEDDFPRVSAANCCRHKRVRVSRTALAFPASVCDK